MDVYDEDGKTLTREEIIRLGRGYLIGEDEPQVRCSKCGRLLPPGAVCGMPQPDGSRCDGVAG